MFRKVIISHTGELTSDTRIVGDTIKYRIYYESPIGPVIGPDIELFITDRLDKHLSHVRAFQGGRYDARTHTVTWRVGRAGARRGAYVEVEGTIDAVAVISNQATLERPGSHPVTTNVVKTTVVARPRLGWIPFAPGGAAHGPPSSYMKDETSTGLTVNFDVAGMFVDEIRVDGVAYHHLSIPSKATLLNIGDPQMPIVGALVEVPHGVNVMPTIVKSASITLSDYNVYPAQKPLPRQRLATKQPFRINSRTYHSNTRYPDVLARVQAEDIGVVRGHRLVFLKIHPLQYNPVTRQMQAFSNIEVRLDYDRPGQIHGIARRLQSREFEALLRSSVLNYKAPERFGRPAPGNDEKELTGCQYLILTHPSLYTASDPNNPVVRLQSWKRRKGLITRVVDVTTLPGGNTAGAIKAFLQSAYDTWYPAPTYVLLMGDAELVPRANGILDSDHENASHQPTPIGTDLDYTKLDGSDYFPDVFLGRISVDTVAQAGDVIDKIIQYEQNPPADANYYTDTSLVCLFEDRNSNGQEDPTFRIIEFAEAIRGYLTGQSYNVQRIYARSGQSASGPTKYEDGTALPAELTLGGDPQAGIAGFAWNGTGADVRAAINGGNFLVTYDGHGNPTRWARPTFGAADINVLTNAGQYPVVLSFACMTGWFDNETDANNVDTNPSAAGVQGLGVNDECFSELLLRRPNAGAAAVIGASRISYEQNDVMMLGAYKAIWPDFGPSPPTSLSLPQLQMGPLVRMGQILDFSKIYMANASAHDFLREATFEMYHLLGDPEMPLWTRAPAAMAVDHPQGIGATGVQDFLVTVTDQASGAPVQSATVTLTRRVTTGGNPVDRILDSRLTSPDGTVRLTLEDIGDGNIDLTVTAVNHAPYSGVIEVAAGGAALNRLEPDNGPEGQTIRVGGVHFSGSEAVDIYLGGQLAATVPAQGGSFGQVGSDVEIQVPSPHPLGPVNVMAVGQQSGRRAVDVFWVRSQNPVDLWTYSQWDSSTWVLHAGNDNPVWDNPAIQLYDGNTPVSSNNLIVGHTYRIEVAVHNDTAFTASQAKVVFRWADFGIGGPWYDFHTATVNVPPGGATATAPFTPPLTGHVCVMAEIHHPEDISLQNNQGQENLHVGAASSPTRVGFQIWNRTENPGAVYLEVRQLLGPDQRLWATRVIHPDPQVLKPGARAEAYVVIDPDVAEPKRGDKARFAVTGFIGGVMIGGVSFDIVKR